MKWFFFILVLANLVLFFWNSQLKIDHQEPVYKPSVQAPRLDLVSEQRQTASESRVLAPADNPEVAVIAPEQAPACEVLGPFEKRRHAVSATEQFKRAGVESVIRPVSVEKQLGYWVLVPQAESRIVAIENMKTLKAAGYDDLWMFNKGELENAISLGLYTSRNRAEQFRNKVDSTGLNPVVKPRTVSNPEFWVEVELLPRSRKKSVLWNDLLTQYPETRRATISCGSIAALQRME